MKRLYEFNNNNNNNSRKGQVQKKCTRKKQQYLRGGLPGKDGSEIK